MRERKDEELLAAAGRGDRKAFGVLVERHHRPIVQFVLRFLGDVDRDTAEDLTQDVFIGAWKSAPRFRPRASVAAWLLRIAANRSLNYRRSLRLRRTVSLDSTSVPEAPDARARTGSAPGMGDDLAECVRSAVGGLPTGQRAAVVLRHYHELSYADIADVLETSVPAVESLLFRARRTLRNTLKSKDERLPQVSAETGAETRRERWCSNAMQEDPENDLGAPGRRAI
jgi:RNA polymerase sigma-70 factor (ECF subfamily)